MSVIFDRAQAPDSSLDAVDNVTVSSVMDVYVCEDGGNMEIGLISPKDTVSPFLRFTGAAHSASEVCGVCFDPSGTRMYMTSQGAFPVVPGQRGPGAVYEVSGPFHLPRGGVPEDFVYGPPAGELRPNGPLNPGPDKARPRLSVRSARRISRRRLTRRGLAVRVNPGEAASVTTVLRTSDLKRRKGKGGSTPRPVSTRLSKTESRVERGGDAAFRLRPDRRTRKRLKRRPKKLRARLVVVAEDAAGNQTTLVRRIRIGAKKKRRRRRSGRRR